LIELPILNSTHRAPSGTALYPLVPMRRGTAFAESLSGYIARLSVEHGLLISDFLDVPCLGTTEVRQVDRRTRRRLFHASSYQIDGSSVHSTRWVAALEAATRVSGLRNHTIVPFLGFSADSWLRAWKAWCPHCYEDWLQSGSTLYDPLLWSIKAVTVCPTHQRAMVERCRFCQKKQRPLTNGYVVGRCGHCRAMLNEAKSAQPIASVCHSSDELESWSAVEIGRLIGTIPWLPLSLDPALLCNTLQALINLDPSSNLDALAACLGITRRSLTTWASGTVRPRLGGLCRLSFQLRAPLLDLIRGNIQSPQMSIGLENLRQTIAGIRGASPRASASGGALPPKEQSLHALIRATEEPFPPSPRSVEKQLGIRCRNLLRRRHPAAYRELCKKRENASAQKMDALRQALQMTTLDGVPRSVKQISKDLGIREEFVSRHFPELKSHLRSRYISWRKSERRKEQNRIEATVKNTVQELEILHEYPSAGRVLDRVPSLRSAGWHRLQRAIQKACEEVSIDD